MRKLIPIKFISRILLVILLIVTINDVHESAHATENHLIAADAQSVHSDISAPHQCPCTPLESQKDYDGCETCVNCVCHAPLTVQPFKLIYNPSVAVLNAFDLFKYLPEVYLSKFIPPQKQV
jgi:hypothetical protein